MAKNIKKIRQNNPLVARMDGGIDWDEFYAQEDAKNGSSEDSGNSGTTALSWVDGITDSVIRLWQNIGSPIFFGSGAGSSGDVAPGQIVTTETRSTVKYLIIGLILIVAIVLIMRYVKK